eukprot:gene9904-20599_t
MDEDFDLDGDLALEEQAAYEYELEMQEELQMYSDHDHVADVTSTVGIGAKTNILNAGTLPSPKKLPNTYTLQGTLRNSPSEKQLQEINESYQIEMEISNTNMIDYNGIHCCDENYYQASSSTYLFNRPPDGTPISTCVINNGTRHFIKYRQRLISSQSQHVIPLYDSLLQKSMKDLLDEAMEIECQREYKIIENSSQRKEQEQENGNGMKPRQSNDYLETNSILFEKSLWVEKYSPKGFSQLLSPEKTNREVLKALKQWDPFVFKKGVLESNRTSDADAVALAMAVDDSNDDEDDIDHTSGKSKKSGGTVTDPRPIQKVILLCGPPGTGKTTLAHVLAVHSGYRPLEVNSSDDRSADFIKEIMSKATQNTTMGGDSRPNCIILDEIDGIDGRAPIDALIAIIKTPLSSRNSNNKKKKKGNSSTSSSSGFALTRPLICICNDQFVPALRELRKYSQVFILGPPAESRLIQRLKAVCALEGLSIGPGPLSAIVRATSGDIRSCINTLQFAAQKCMSSINNDVNNNNNQNSNNNKESSILSKSAAMSRVLSSMLSSGLKDEQRDIFQIWKEILCTKEIAETISRKNYNVQFQNHLHEDKPSVISSSNSNSSGKLKQRQSTGYLGEVVDGIVEYGDDQLVTSGVFENIFQLRYSDPTFIKTQLVSEWLSYADEIDSFARSGDNSYQVMSYVPWAVGAVHTMCAGDTRAKVKYPAKGREVFVKRLQRQGILQSLVEGDHTSSSATTSSKITPLLRSSQVIAVDSLSFLYDLITPKLRSVPLLSMSAVEKDNISAAIQVMSACGISYSPAPASASVSASEFGNNGQLQLDPAIDQLLSYPTPVVAETVPGRRMSMSSSAASTDNGISPLNVHRVLTPDIKSLLNAELKRYMISAKQQEDGVVDKTLPTKVFTTNNSITTTTTNTTNTSTNKNIVASIPMEKKAMYPVAPVAITTSAMGAMNGEVRARSGRMDFFCVKKSIVTTDTAKRKSDDSSSADNKNTYDAKDTVHNSDQRKKQKVFFKFNQGFSNANKVSQCVNIISTGQNKTVMAVTYY